MHIEKLITHSGPFHADEVMSTVVLRALFPSAEILRTRDEVLTSPASGRIIYDVGGSYDAQALIFDHHQRGGPLRENGALYSSFGLIWKHFGRDYLSGPCKIPAEILEQIYTRLDNKFVAKIDMVDTGELSPSSAGDLANLLFTSLIGNFSPSFDEDSPAAMDEAFIRAVDFASLVFGEEIRKQSSKLRAKELALMDIEAAGDSPVLELSRGMPFIEALRESGKDHFLFVVTPRPDGTWTIGAIRTNEDSYDDKVKLPEAWAGLRGEDLASVTGVDGAIFCHMARFIAAADSREGIMAMARQAVDAAHSQSAS